MFFRVFVEEQPDHDWMITDYQDEDNLINPPSSPWIHIQDDITLLQMVAAATTGGLHLRNFTPFIQNHLAVTPGHVSMSFDDFKRYQSLV